LSLLFYTPTRTLPVYTMKANGSNQKNRSNNAASDSVPDWQPL
jgi:hypothetical protein